MLEPCFSTSALMTLAPVGAVLCIVSLASAHIVPVAPTVSRHCQMSPRGQNHPHVRTPELGDSIDHTPPTPAQGLCVT